MLLLTSTASAQPVPPVVKSQGFMSVYGGNGIVNVRTRIRLPEHLQPYAPVRLTETFTNRCWCLMPYFCHKALAVMRLCGQAPRLY